MKFEADPYLPKAAKAGAACGVAMSRSKRGSLVRMVFILSCLVPVCIAPASSSESIEPKLGNAHFPTTCNSLVQTEFDHAVALLHSFEFDEAARGFRHIEVEDPTCSIAAWGVGLATLERLGPAMPAATLASGWKELKPWLNRPPKSQREQMYISAVSMMYRDFETVSSEERWDRYIKAMSQIRRQYPKDVNVSLFYAFALACTAGSGKEGIKRRELALNILLPIFREHPDNPGAAHYIIHSADTPELASIGLPAARKYAEIAPDSPHALHMPSHIFNRLGLWQESITSNVASWRVAAQWVKEGRGGTFDELHALNNLEYAYLQLGQHQKAREVIDQIDQAAAGSNGDPWAGKDARIYYDVETHDWRDATKIDPPAKSSFQENFDVYWIRAISFARLAMPEKAEEELDKYRRSSEEWTQGHAFAGGTLRLAGLQAEAWVLFSQGSRREAVAKLKEALQYEEEHPMYYADILPRPSAELLGDMFLEMGKPSPALAAYKTSLKMAPNRFDSLSGEQLSKREIGGPAR